jgi:type II secretory pathway pseudopilin PulG
MPMSTSRSRPGPLGGFTLIEVVVVIGIIVLTVSFIAPSVAKMFQNRKIENACTLIASTLNEARNGAVTRKQVHRVVFLHEGLRLYREPKGRSILGGFEGQIRSFDPDNAGTISYTLTFAGLPGKGKEIPRELSVIGGDRPPPEEEWTVTPEDISLRFLPDGTIDFGAYQDIPSYQFHESPPTAADIVIHRMGDPGHQGFIDIRPTGRTVFKVEEVE